MKKKLSLVIVFLVMLASFTQAQSKKDVEDQLATCVTAKDSIQNSLMDLSAKYDSINVVNSAYGEMYIAVKEKVFQDDFDPANMAAMIDSLQAKNSFANAALSDSLSTLQEEIVLLKEMAITKEIAEESKSEVVNDLKQLKELLDSGILSQKEFDTKKAELLEKL